MAASCLDEPKYVSPFARSARPESSTWPWRLLAGLLILGTAALHLAYLARPGSLDLAPDEAHYWDWSRHLDWSYYSKGPLVAYLIRLGCAAFGGWSEALIGSEAFAVRVPAVVCGSLLLVSLYLLTIRVFTSDRLALAVVAAALIQPIISAGSSLMTIDAPYTCCWGWALVLAHHAIFNRSTWAWWATGLVVGIGILAKYTMVLFVPSLALFLITSPTHRQQCWRSGFWSMCLIGAACCLPIVIWNIQHDWISLRHVSGQAHLEDSGGLRWWGPLEYLAVQAGLLLGVWFVVWVQAMIRHAPYREKDEGIRYLWWLSAPMFALFWGFTLKAPEEPNWPITAYLSGLVLAVGFVAREFQNPALRWRRARLACLVGGATLGIGLTLLMHDTRVVQPWLIRLSGSPTADRPLPLRRFDPTCRLRGWRTLAAAVDQLREECRAAGTEPILVATSWTLPGELGFYCTGHPTVHTIGLLLGDRHSQYDFWRPQPLTDPDVYLGRTFILVGSVPPVLQFSFDVMESPRTVTHSENGQPIAQWEVTIARGFRGFRYVAVPAEVTSY